MSLALDLLSSEHKSVQIYLKNLKKTQIYISHMMCIMALLLGLQPEPIIKHHLGSLVHSLCASLSSGTTFEPARARLMHGAVQSVEHKATAWFAWCLGPY